MKNQEIIFRKGNKVILRPVQESDIPLFQKWMNNPKVTHFLANVFPITFIDEKNWYDSNSKSTKDRVILAIVDRKTKKLIGTMGMNNIDYISGVATTGSVIGDERYWGKGYGTEAKMLLLELAFNELNLRKLYSEVIVYNERSLAFSNKCGYKEEARLKEHYYRSGQYHDQVILSVFRSDWQDVWEKYSSENKIKIR